MVGLLNTALYTWGQKDDVHIPYPQGPRFESTDSRVQHLPSGKQKRRKLSAGEKEVAGAAAALGTPRASLEPKPAVHHGSHQPHGATGHCKCG